MDQDNAQNAEGGGGDCAPSPAKRATPLRSAANKSPLRSPARGANAAAADAAAAAAAPSAVTFCEVWKGSAFTAPDAAAGATPGAQTELTFGRFAARQQQQQQEQQQPPAADLAPEAPAVTAAQPTPGFGAAGWLSIDACRDCLVHDRARGASHT